MRTCKKCQTQSVSTSESANTSSPHPWDLGDHAFKKDILNLVYICKSFDLHEAADYWMNVVSINNWQKERFVARIIYNCFNTISQKKFVILGFSFKADTGDTRESPAIDVCNALLQEGANVEIVDPKVTDEQLSMEMKTPMQISKDVYAACKDAHGVCVMTDWKEFKSLDYQKIYNCMSKPAQIFDGRNALDKPQLEAIGFKVHSIGKASAPIY